MSDMVPEGWRSKKFKDVCGVVNGQVDPTNEPYSNMKHIGPGNVEKFTGRLFEVQTASQDGQTSGKYLFNDTDVLYGKINPHLAKVAFPRYSGVCSADMYPINCSDDLIPEYLYHHLLSDEFTNYAVSVSGRTGMPKINRDDLDLATFRVPPLPEQKKIASILTSVDEVIEKTQLQINKLQDLKKGTMNELLTKGIGHTEFKDSELGRIPKSWEIYELGKLCIFTQGVQIALDETLRKNRKGYIRYLYINDFSSDKNLRFVKNKFPMKIVDDKDLVMANTGHSAGTIFRGKHGVLSNNAFKISIKKKINSEYLFHYLSTENYWFNITKLFNTAGQPHVGHDNISKLLFLCPPLDEQDKITSIIKSIDKHIIKKETVLSQSQSLKKSLMQDLLTGKVRVTVN